jgi:hypothetical protein
VTHPPPGPSSPSPPPGPKDHLLPTLQEVVADLEWHVQRAMVAATAWDVTTAPGFDHRDPFPSDAEIRLGRAVADMRSALAEISRITVDHPAPGRGLPDDAASPSVAAAPAAAGGGSYRPRPPASGRDAGDTNSFQAGSAYMDAYRQRPVGGYRWPGTDELAESVYRATRKART